MKYTLLTVLLFIFTNLSVAGEARGLVTSIQVADDSHAILFQLDGEIKGTPRCNESGRFALSLRKFGGMAGYMALLEAKREKYEVRVEGLNTCANHWKSEDVLDIQIR